MTMIYLWWHCQGVTITSHTNSDVKTISCQFIYEIDFQKIKNNFSSLRLFMVQL